MQGAVRVPILLGLTLAGILWVAFGTARGGSEPTPPEEATPAAFTLNDWKPSAAAVRGRKVYETWCIGCHGETGLGDGPAAAYLNPLPRNFQRGKFKFRSTASGQMPTRDDLLRTVTCGLVGSSMPKFPLLAESHKRDVVEYVLYLSSFGLAKTNVEILMEIDELSLDEIQRDHMEKIRTEVMQQIDRPQVVGVGPEPATDDASIAAGKKVFEAQCVQCHGAKGKGDGATSFTQRDWKDAEIQPRDLTTGVFRAGNSGKDLFLRLKTGLFGTSMPAIAGTDDDLWHLVHFIQSLKEDTVFPLGRQGCTHEGGHR